MNSASRVGISEQPPISLAYLPPTPRQTRAILAGAVALLFIWAVLIPLAAIPLPQANGFIPALDAIISVTDFITAGLLLVHFSITRSTPLLALACGYLFSALIVAIHMLTFPGAFLPVTDFPSAVRYNFRIYLFWHFGLPTALFAYMWLRHKERTKPVVPAPTALLAGGSFAVVLALVGGLAWFASAGDRVLPSPYSNFNPYSSPVPSRLIGLTMLICAAALSALWIFRRSALDQWLMIVVFASMFELAITGHFGWVPHLQGEPGFASRFSVGFYTGRLIFSIVTSTAVLVALLAETTGLYARLTNAKMLANTVKASQALSSEIELPRLIERLLKIAIENAGADRGLLLLPSGNDFLIQAEARANGDRIEVMIRQEPITLNACPKSLVSHVIRTRENLILDDASMPNQFSGDVYLRDRQSKSILCLPLVKQRELTGILLLENALTSHAFTPARVAVLELLTAQAAISLENTRLYNEIKEREAKIWRLVEANIIGIYTSSTNGEVVYANEAFLQLINYSHDDLVSGRVRWTDFTPVEWRERDEQALAELRLTGRFQPFEKEFIRKDGSRVPILIGGALFEADGSEGIAFIVDLSEQKRAEAAMLRAQGDLAHVSRLTTLGEMTASIAHEVNQPLGSVVNNANACLSILANDTYQLEDVRQALAEIIEGADRASAVVSRVRQLSKKVPYERALVSLKDVVKDVLALADNEAARRQVTINTDLTDGLLSIMGDLVQLQQVLLNLVVNGMDAMSNIEPAKRIMTISGRRETRDGEHEALVSVQDAGIGLKPEEKDRLFEAFYSTKPEGMGMGLAISRSIIEAHGGRLWAETNRGVGATFLFRLPIANQNES